MMGRSKQKSTTTSPTNLKAFREQCLSTITADLEKIKTNNLGKIPYRVLTEKVRECQKEIPWVSIDMVKYHIRKLND
jgi:hypothetical protein